MAEQPAPQTAGEEYSGHFDQIIDPDNPCGSVERAARYILTGTPDDAPEPQA